MKHFLKIHKHTLRENTLISLIFIMSLYNKWLLLLAIILSVLLLKRGILGVIQLIYLYTTRNLTISFFDTSDSAYDLTYAIYILIYVIGIFFLIRHIKRWVRSYLIFTFALASITLMLIYIIMSLITSNDPLYSITKLINYFIPLIIIVTLVYLIKEVDELIKWLANQVVTFILFTLILLVMSLIKVLSQEQSFKGFFNDSNTFAVFLILGLLTLIISSMKYHKFNFFVMFVMMSGIFELYVTHSKLAWFVFIVCLFLSLLLLILKRRYKYLTIPLIISIIILSIFQPSIHYLIKSFVLNGNSVKSVLMPKDNQIKNIENVLETHMLMGNGFGMSLHGLTKNSDIVAGNMVFELIMFTGVIGLACYVIYVLKVMLLATYMFKLTFVLFIATLLTNTIEIVMFNAINIGALCYILWGIYLKDGLHKDSKNKMVKKSLEVDKRNI